MRRFLFRPQRVLDLRTRELDAARLALARAQARAARAQAELHAAAAERQRWQAALRSRRGQGGSVGRWAADWAHLQRLQAAEAAAAGALQEALGALAARREEFAAARQRQRALERLREVRWEQFRRDLAAAEQREMDDWTQRRRSGAGPEGGM